MKSTQNLPSKLKQLRKANNYSQEYIAENLNISRQAVSNWENGKAYPDIDNLVLLAELYHVTVDELLNDQTKPSEEPDDGDPTDETGNGGDNDNVPHEPDDVKESFSLFEMMVLSAILLLASNLYIIGIPVAVCILIWSVYTKRHYKLVYILCAVCVIVNLHEIIILLAHFNWAYGSSYIIPQ